MDGLSAEFRFVIACCRLSALGDVGGFDRAPLDWERMAALARRHRVVGMVWHAIATGMAEPPSAMRDELAREARINAARMLRNAAAEGELVDDLARRGIAATVLKGAVLGARLYGDVTRKTSWDVDLWVAPGDVAAAARRLAELGYIPQPIAGVDTPARWRTHLAEVHETAWWHAGRGVAVELHSRLFDPPRWLDRLMPTAAPLADGALYAFLCLHGSLHRWARLKWLVDAVALAATAPAMLHEQACRQGAGRASAVTLMLGERLFGLPAPRRLERGTLERALRDRALAELDDRTKAGLRDDMVVLAVRFALAPGPAALPAMLWHEMTAPRWPAHYRVPRWLRPLMTLALLPVRLARRHARLHGRGAPADQATARWRRQVASALILDRG